MSAHQQHHWQQNMSTCIHTDIPDTRNEGWGFWGTMGGYASIAWPLAMSAIAEATGQPLEDVRAFLDSSYGRHFADDVRNGQHRGQSLADAITGTTATWMLRKADGRMNRDYGTPRGLPHLLGFVIVAASADDLED
jgi:hypothetical protein